MKDTTPTDPLARMTRTMGLVTATMTALVALNTMVFSCANDRFSREAAALSRLDGESRYWTEAMKDLDELIATRPADPDNDRNWADRCDVLASRSAAMYIQDRNAGAGSPKGALGVPAAGNDIESEKIGMAMAQVAKLREEFRDKIEQDRFVGIKCAPIFGKLDGKLRETARITQEVAAKQPDFAVANDVQTALQLRRPTIDLTPVSPSGWDIDVFWCERPNNPTAEAANFEDALNIGSRLGGIVQNGEKVGGETLGRIRVRMLSARMQVLPTTSGNPPTVYPNSGRTIRYDALQQDEERLAKALSMLLGGNIPPSPQRTGSKWYLSVFSCNAGTPPKDTPATANAPNATAD